MNNIYQHTLRYSDLANARPTFQSHLEINGADPNLNRSTKRYYSSTDVSIYFGDFFIDDASYIDFEVTESAMLLYGYNSYVFDDIAKGARMIQGRFAINFTQANYLSKVISDISVCKGSGAITHSRYHALWPIGFDLFVHHGSPDSKDLELIMLQDIYITGCSMQSDPRTGEPMKEVYTFVGRDIKFGAELENNNELVAPEKQEDPDDYVVDDMPIIKIGRFNDEITVEFRNDVPIEKARYCFDDDTIFSAKNIVIHPNGIAIMPTTMQTHKWDQSTVYVKIAITFKNAKIPQEYEATLARS